MAYVLLYGSSGAIRGSLPASSYKRVLVLCPSLSVDVHKAVIDQLMNIIFMSTLQIALYLGSLFMLLDQSVFEFVRKCYKMLSK